MPLKYAAYPSFKINTYNLAISNFSYVLLWDCPPPKKLTVSVFSADSQTQQIFKFKWQSPLTAVGIMTLSTSDNNKMLDFNMELPFVSCFLPTVNS